MSQIIAVISIVLLVIYVMPSIVYSMILLITGPLTAVSAHLLGITVSYFLMCLLTLLLKEKYKVKFNAGEKISYKKDFIDLLLIVMASLGSCLFFSFEFTMPFLQRGLPRGMTIEMYNKLYHSFGMMTATILLMPVCEELLFRGTLMNIFSRFSNMKTGIMISAFLFSIMHGWTAPFVFIPACIYGYVYAKKKHIVFPIIFHVSNNLAAAMIVKLQIVNTDSLNINVIIIGLLIWIVCLSILAAKYARSTGSLRSKEH